MNFEFVHTFSVPLEKLESALLDPALPAVLGERVKGYRQVAELERKEDGAQLVRRVRYVPRVDLPSFAAAKIRPEMMEWVEESTYDRTRHAMECVIAPNIPDRWKERFSMRTTQTLRASGAESQRVIRGDVNLKITLIGGLAERFTISEFKKNYEAEAEALRSFMQK